jgi:Methyltransferase domain
MRYCYARRCMERPPFHDLIAARSGALPPSYYDLWYLSYQIRQLKPVHVLEFGVGYSTLIIAATLARNGSGTLTSVDANRDWLEATRDALPVDLHPYVTLVYAPLEVTKAYPEACHQYLFTPTVTPNLIYIDGPDPHDVPNWTGKPIAADPLPIESRLPAGTVMIIDARLENVSFLRRHLKRRWTMKTDQIFKITMFTLD